MTKSLIGKFLNKGNPIPFSAAWNSRGGMYGTGTQDRHAQLSASGSQGTMFGIIQLLSTGAQSQGDWAMYRKRTDGRQRYSSTDTGSDTRVEVLQHQALRLWNQPNDFMTGPEFREIGWQHMELTGEWYWVLNRGPSGTSIPIEMWPVRPDRMEPVPDKDKFLVGWVYTGANGESVPLSTDEVIQIRYPHPTDFYRGLSAVQAILVDIDAAKYSAEWSRNFFLNSAQPGGIVTFAKRLTDDEFLEFTDRWREQHQGIARGHRVGVLEQGATWTPNTYSMHDMQFAELRHVTSDMLRQAYRIHQSMMGESTDVNRANAQTAQEVHIAWHEIPRLKREKNVLNTRFLRIFGDEDKVEFDFEDPSPDNREEDNMELTTKSAAAVAMVGAGYDPHDVLRVVGLPDMKFKAPAPPTPAPGSGDQPGQEPASGQPGQPSKPGQTGKPGSPGKPGTKGKPGQPGDYLDDDGPWDGPDLEDIGTMVREAFSEAKNNGHKEHV